MRSVFIVVVVAAVVFLPALALGFESEIREMSGPTCSPDGETIVFSMDVLTSDGSNDLWRINMDGTGLTQLTATPDDEEYPAYSPNGQYIAYSRANDMYIMDADGANPVRVNRESRSASSPAWQNDSLHLAIETSCTYSGDIMLIDRLGAEDELLAVSPTEDENSPNISGDGVWMAYEIRSDCSESALCSQIWKRNIATNGTPIQLTTDHYSDERPRFSPNGSRIVFQSDRDRENGHASSLYIMNADGTDLTRINLSGDAEDPTWTSDGTHIVFVLRETDTNAQNSVANLASVLPDGTGLTRITQTVAAPQMTPDGGLTSGPLTVEMSCPTPSATIRYTTDGTWPTESSPIYSDPIAINNHGITLLAKAWKTGYLPSLISDALYEFMPATPTFSLASGTYTSPQNVTISCETSSVAIRYTTDGTYPTESSTLYTGPISIDYSLTLTANAWKTGWLDSAIKIADYELKLPTPTFNPDGGTYQGSQNVTISCSVSGATIRYTTDGTDPTESSALYTGPVTVDDGLTLKAKAWKTDWTSSDIRSAVYEFQLPTPTFNPDGGEYEETQHVTISCAVSGATIRYTTDGSAPTESSTEYTSPVTISQNTTLKAKAWKTDWTASDIKSAVYHIEDD